MIRNVNTDLIAGALGLVLSFAFWWLIDPDITQLSIVFPMAMIVGMALISALLFLKGLTKTAERQDIFAEGSNLRVLVTAFFFFGWAAGIAYLGFFVASVLAMALLALYLAWASRRVKPLTFVLWVGIVTCEVAFFYVIFTRLLHVPLPEGWFF